MVEVLPEYEEISVVIEKKLTEHAAKGFDYMNFLADTALSSNEDIGRDPLQFFFSPEYLLLAKMVANFKLIRENMEISLKDFIQDHEESQVK